jgi:transcriptional regulator with XRE-family HTH domain
MQSTIADEIRSRLRVRRDLPAPAQCRALREAAELTQQELADVLGVSKQTVSYWETGARSPRGARLYRYAEALNALREAV